EILDAENIIEAVVEAHTFLEDEDIDKLSSFDLYVRYKPSEALFAKLIERYQPMIVPREHESLLSNAYVPMLEDYGAISQPTSLLCQLLCCESFHVYPPHSPTLCPVACPITSKKMRYRHEYTNNNGTIADIFDLLWYLELRDLFVVIDGKAMPYKYFQEAHEIALGISMDARGVAAVDVNQHQLFALRAHLLTIFGDIPALTKVLEFVGHNGCLPCRFCLMPTPDGFCMDPLDLPLRDHDQCISTGLKVLKAKNKAEQKRLATESGIKGVTLLACVPSVSIPCSLPVDLMHMIWQNLIPQLIKLWTGDFNDMDAGLEDYHLRLNAWNAVCDACIPSKRTIPSSFGCPVPDPRKPSHFIAESWNIFTTQLAPSLLYRQFSDEQYYQHFVWLVRILRLVVLFDLPRDKIPEIRRGLAEWVEEYEHFIVNSVKSRRYPYANIDKRVLNRARLQVILHKYQLIDKAPFTGQKRPEESDGATIVRGYPLAFLLSPHSTPLRVDRHLRQQIVRYLTTSFEILSDAAEALIPDELEQWGVLYWERGNEVARGYHKLRSDGRDAAFVRTRMQSWSALKKNRYLLLAQIYEAPIESDEIEDEKLIWYKGKLGTGEVVDVSTIQCAVGRIKDGNRWWIVDRSTDNTFAYPETSRVRRDAVWGRRICHVPEPSALRFLGLRLGVAPIVLCTWSRLQVTCGGTVCFWMPYAHSRPTYILPRRQESTTNHPHALEKRAEYGYKYVIYISSKTSSMNQQYRDITQEKCGTRCGTTPERGTRVRNGNEGGTIWDWVPAPRCGTGSQVRNEGAERKELAHQVQKGLHTQWNSALSLQCKWVARALIYGAIVSAIFSVSLQNEASEGYIGGHSREACSAD
ncbi:Transposase family tnp2, partial [Rhizoctonia solani]